MQFPLFRRSQFWISGQLLSSLALAGTYCPVIRETAAQPVEALVAVELLINDESKSAVIDDISHEIANGKVGPISEDAKSYIV